MRDRFENLVYKSSFKKYIILFLFLLIMLIMHHYVFIYADDLYYSRDGNRGLSYLPYFISSELKANGRIWIHLLLLSIVKYNVYLFRIINPIIITLAALLLSKIGVDSDKSNKNFFIATVAACMFFLYLPVAIASTSIYYAADSLNYLYAPITTILYSYLLYCDYRKKSPGYKTNWLIFILAFFAGSSTQQSGMIAIGFTVMIPLYYTFIKKIRFQRGIIPYFAALIAGYSIITYGSLMRMLYEKNTGAAMNLKSSATALLKTNIFSIPVVFYVLIICLCCGFWIFYYTVKTNSKLISIVNKLWIVILFLGGLGYSYALIYKKYNVAFFADGGINPILRISYIGFILVYLISVLYVLILILLKEKNPFLLFCGINAFGAQIMLLVVDSRFAGSYRCMFPSLLLMCIFIIYSVIKFHNNKIFLSMILFTFALSHTKVLLLLAALVIVLFCIVATIYSYNLKYLKTALVLMILLSAFAIFGVVFKGYVAASYAQSFNLNAINEYHKSADKSVLKLEETPPTEYGYNVGLWNDIPLFMKQCYKIDEKTKIEYYK